MEKNGKISIFSTNVKINLFRIKQWSLKNICWLNIGKHNEKKKKSLKIILVKYNLKFCYISFRIFLYAFKKL